MTDLGQVMHGLVHEVRRHYGMFWPERVAVLNPEVLERLDLVKLQGYPDLLLFPVQLAFQHFVYLCMLVGFNLFQAFPNRFTVIFFGFGWSF